MGRLEGKVALVTGSAQGIGRSIAHRFAEEGARVGVLDINGQGARRVTEEIKGRGGHAITLEADLTNEGSVNGAVAQLKEAFGPITVLVNNAAVDVPGRVHDVSPADFDRCIAANLRGTYLVTRAVIPDMMKLRIGSIIHMSSVTAVLGLPGLAVYAATKGALVSLTMAMSTDYAKYGIRTNCVSPGTINSPMLDEWIAAQSDPERTRRGFDEMHPIGRVGTPNEVANVFLFLASDEASFVCGANYSVDGGLSAKGTQPQDEPEG
jgi:NAD(P)-dependent dehydrogenase (short-subunit alcohol dehydrogenase family)